MSTFQGLGNDTVRVDTAQTKARHVVISIVDATDHALAVLSPDIARKIAAKLIEVADECGSPK